MNQDNRLSAIDALHVINYNRQQDRDGSPEESFSEYGKKLLVDVNGDARVTALDALTVINELERRGLSLSLSHGTAALNESREIYVSSHKHGRVDGLRFDREDILVFNTADESWGLYFDGSDVGLATADVGAFHILSDNEMLLSIDRAGSLDLPGLGRTNISQSDIYKFTAQSLGDDTEGVFSRFFDGSEVGLHPATEAIDALALASDGSLIISTSGSFNLDGGAVIGDEQDLLRFIPDHPNEYAAGHWEIYLDGSDIELTTNKEDVWGVSIDPQTNELYFTTRKEFDVGLRGGGLDILAFTPTGAR